MRFDSRLTVSGKPGAIHSITFDRRVIKNKNYSSQVSTEMNCGIKMQ